MKSEIVQPANGMIEESKNIESNGKASEDANTFMKGYT